MSAKKSDPATVNSQWEKVRLRLQNASPTNGQAIVSIKIVVSYECPLAWTEPEITMIEPKTSSLIDVIAALSP